MKKLYFKNYIKEFGLTPSLLIIQVGNNEASNRYVRNKVKDCEEVGISAKVVECDENINTDELIKVIRKQQWQYNGIIVQLPLPSHLNETDIINEIDNSKDVDGFGLINKGKLFCGIDFLVCIAQYNESFGAHIEEQVYDAQVGNKAVARGKHLVVRLYGIAAHIREHTWLGHSTHIRYGVHISFFGNSNLTFKSQ